MKTLILAEHDGQQLSPLVYQAVTAALFWQAPIDLLVVGDNISNVALEAAAIADVQRVIQVDAPHLQHQLAENVAEIIRLLSQEDISQQHTDQEYTTQEFSAQKYNVILAAHTAFSRNSLPRAAALLDVDMLSDVLAIKADNIYVRAIYAGSINTTIQSLDAIQVLTIHSNHFAAAAQNNHPVEIVRMAVDLVIPAKKQQSRWLSETRIQSERPALSEAKVVISGGGALGSAENFNHLLSPLANKLGAAIGASRAAIDAGFAHSDMLIGQSGVVVAPDLYIAVGISGAVQHTYGMKDSKVVVAINQDPESPIFQVADYWLVADLFQAVPELTAAIN